MAESKIHWPLSLMTNLQVNRVDLVNEGADSEAFIKFFKSRGGIKMTIEELVAKMKPENQKVVADALAAAATNATEVAKSQQNALIAGANKALQCPDCVKLGHVCPTCKAAIQGSGVSKMKDDAVKEMVDSINSILAVATKVQKNKPTGNEDNEEEVLKSLDPAVRAIIEKSRMQAAAAEEAVKKMKEDTLNTEAVAKSAAIDSLGMKSEELVELYKSLKGETRDTVFATLAKANKAVKEGDLFKEVGSGKEDPTADAWSQLEAKANEIAKSAKITKEAAIAKAMKDNPDLYRAYVESMEQ